MEKGEDNMVNGRGQAMMDLFIDSVKSILAEAQKALFYDLNNQFDPYGNLSTSSSYDNFCNTLFSKNFTYDQFIAHVVFWIYKDFYIDNRPRKAISELNKTQDIIEDSTMDQDVYRRYINRGLNKACERKRQDAARLGTSTEYIELVAKKEKQAGEKSKIYHLAELDIPAIESYQSGGLEIIHLLERGTIGDSKGGVSGEKIASAYREYLAYIKKGEQQSDSEAWIDALIDLSSLESQSCPTFLYAVAKYMSANEISHIPEPLALLCGLMKTGNGGIQSRFLCNRIQNIPQFFQDDFTLFSACLQFESLLRLQRIVLFTAKTDSGIKKVFHVITSDAAKSYFSAQYNLFSACSADEWDTTTWNPALVKAYRKVIRTLTHDGYEKSTADASQDEP